ncbi:unnamed protein product [Arctogadus glacialis]
MIILIVKRRLWECQVTFRGIRRCMSAAQSYPGHECPEDADQRYRVSRDGEIEVPKRQGGAFRVRRACNLPVHTCVGELAVSVTAHRFQKAGSLFPAVSHHRTRPQRGTGDHTPGATPTWSHAHIEPRPAKCTPTWKKAHLEAHAPGDTPPGAMPPGATPPGAMPPGATPTLSHATWSHAHLEPHPPGAMPPGAMPTWSHATWSHVHSEAHPPGATPTCYHAHLKPRPSGFPATWSHAHQEPRPPVHKAGRSGLGEAHLQSALL